MNQWKAIAAILLIFGSGAGTGYLLKSRQAPPDNSNPPGGTSQFAPLNSKSSKSKMEPVFFRSSAHLNRHLDLTAEQQKQIRAIMDNSRARIAEEGAEFRDLVQAEHSAWENAVREVLTPPQKKKFEKISGFKFRKDSGRPSGRPSGGRNRPPENQPTPKPPTPKPADPPKSSPGSTTKSV